MIVGTKSHWLAFERHTLFPAWSIRWPSKRYTQVELTFNRWGIQICNNIGGQLGPERLSHGIYWSRILKYGIRIH